jgi:hypothetical protein
MGTHFELVQLRTCIVSNWTSSSDFDCQNHKKQENVVQTLIQIDESIRKIVSNPAWNLDADIWDYMILLCAFKAIITHIWTVYWSESSSHDLELTLSVISYQLDAWSSQIYWFVQEILRACMTQKFWWLV